MPTVFIVRPFGKKPVTVDENGVKKSVEVDFDLIDQTLIQPALKKSGLAGETTGVIAEAGNIRVDMFQMLITYDLVIADISVDNANVFYELGIRHGLRPKGTILIRFPTVGKDVPFDLKTDRYIAYDWKAPDAAVELLARSIEDTLLSIRQGQKPDSPVFGLLPALSAPDPASLVAVPRAFREAVEKAEAEKYRTTLALLAEEAKRLPWGREGLRLIGGAQRRLGAFAVARETWEAVRRDLPDDIDANLMLATIYQRLGDPVTSSHACRRVLDNELAAPAKRADAYSQLARNDKAAWVSGFRASTIDDPRRQAISDNRLIDALKGYQSGFAEDLNDYYSGLNALGLLTALVRMAEQMPEDWASQFPTTAKADTALGEYRESLGQLTGAVHVALDAARRRSERTRNPDEWLLVSEAQYRLLTTDRPTFVRRAYTAARNAFGQNFPVQSEADQVAIFHLLGLLADNCREALAGLGLTPADLAGQARPQQPARDRVVVATGHRADASSRPPPGRFPNTATCIDKAKGWLREALKAEKAETAGALSGIAGAASGVDLLFHEACKELGIPTKVCLPIPIEAYRRESVTDGGPDWVEKFNHFIAENPPIILSDSDELPPWAAKIKDYGVFQRGNIWNMQDALLRPNADVTLVALWNQKAGEGPGGTADMVKLAKSHGAKVREQNSDELFGISSS
jgi:hypothetical protein